MPKDAATDPPTGEDAICGYCGEPVLTGAEVPEHALPLAINARLTTKSVCVPCNTKAGRDVDKPWLRDPFVLETRFWHVVPDRDGDVLEHDPFMAGVTEDNVRVRMRRNGTIEALNSHVVRDQEAGEVHISAPDEVALEKILARERKRAEAVGKSFLVGDAEHVSSTPWVTVSSEVSPAVWERMATKAVLGLLTKTQPSAWRLSPMAMGLRNKLAAPKRPAGEVELTSADAYAPFAEKPCSVVAVRELQGRTFAQVSLMGIFALIWELDGTISGIDVVWVSDPLRPTSSVMGRLMTVIAERVEPDTEEAR